MGIYIYSIKVKKKNTKKPLEEDQEDIQEEASSEKVKRRLKNKQTNQIKSMRKRSCELLRKPKRKGKKYQCFTFYSRSILEGCCQYKAEF